MFHPAAQMKKKRSKKNKENCLGSGGARKTLKSSQVPNEENLQKSRSVDNLNINVRFKRSRASNNASNAAINTLNMMNQSMINEFNFGPSSNQSTVYPEKNFHSLQNSMI